MRDFLAGVCLVLIGVAGFSLNVGAIDLAGKSQREWEAFKVEHQCKHVGHIDGDKFNTVGVVPSSGQVVIGIGSTPSKEGWACNDGITYWR